MPATSLQAYSEQVARAFGLDDQGELIAGRWCLHSPHGPLCLSAFEGDPLFLDWLGPWLEDAQGVTNRLSISPLLPATTSHYYTTINGQTIILRGYAAGPPCDVHNSFELFSVSAGVAWVHQLGLGKTIDRTAGLMDELKRVRQDAQRLVRPKLPRRVLPVWELLMETWQLCLEQAEKKWFAVKFKGKQSLLLGIEQFQDFVYVADRHLVHYNAVERCSFGLPAIELATLLRASEYNLQTAEAMLVSYQRVRPLSDDEKQQLLACLWFPWEVTVQDLMSPDLTIMAINRLRRLLEQKVAWVAELGEQLLPGVDDELEEPDDCDSIPVARIEPGMEQIIPEESALDLDDRTPKTGSAALSIEKEGPILPEKKAAEQKLVTPKEQVEQVVPVAEETIAEPEAKVESVQPSIKLQSVPEKKVLVWKPFPRPLGAPPEEPEAAVEAEQEAEPELEPEEAENLEMTEPVVEEAAPSVDDTADEEDLEP